MRNSILVVFIFGVLSVLGQEIPKKKFNQIVDYNCSCHDSIDINQRMSLLESQMSSCYIQSLDTYLTGEKYTDFLNDTVQVNDLKIDVFNALQPCAKTAELIKKINEIPTPHSTVPFELFLSETDLTKYGLSKGQKEAGFIVWNGDVNNSVHRLVDIRWVFDSNEEALRYHRAKLKSNSEDGQPLVESIELAGAEELYLFKESLALEKMMRQLNLPQKQFYFLFVVENVVFKIFVATAKTTTIQEIVPIPEAAIARTIAYNKK